MRLGVNEWLEYQSGNYKYFVAFRNRGDKSSYIPLTREGDVIFYSKVDEAMEIMEDINKRDTDSKLEVKVFGVVFQEVELKHPLC
jgi:hypothetical protein